MPFDRSARPRVVLVPIVTVDLALFGANTLKIPSGGWFPLVIGLAVFAIMTTWRTGRRLVLTQLASEAVPLDSFLATCEEAPEARVSGYASVDTGFIGQNVYLFCASEGLATVFRGAIDYPKLARAMTFPEQQFVTFAQTVGCPRA